MAHVHHNHSHGHHHGHSHGPGDYGRAFAVGVALNLGFVGLEAGYGLLSGSLALLADAGHNLSDVLGLLLAWGASVLARRRPTARYTYGLRRSSILAALANGVLLLVATGGVAWEAVRRFSSPSPVEGGVVALVAGVGILVNAGTALMFARGSKGDLNVRGAYLHMAADAAVSLGVVLAGLAILATGWGWLDPAVSLLVSAVIVWGTWGLLRDALGLALDAVPPGIEPDAVRTYLAGLPGVAEVHDLHVWGMSTTEAALTAHLVAPGGVDDAFFARVAKELHDRFGIEHPTIQVEGGSAAHPCGLAAEGAV